MMRESLYGAVLIIFSLVLLINLADSLPETPTHSHPGLVESNKEDEDVIYDNSLEEDRSGPLSTKGLLDKLKVFGRIFSSEDVVIDEPQANERDSNGNILKSAVRVFGRSLDDDDYDDDDASNPNDVSDDKLNKSPSYEIKYLQNVSDGINSPKLKHDTMYSATFYPPWSYYGFSPPIRWHEIPIEYFTRPPRQQFDIDLLKKHKSAMHICSKKVTSNTRKCQETMENECISDLPSPIDILTHEAVEDKNLDYFNFKHFDTFFEFRMFLPEDGTDLLFLTFIPPKRDVNKRPGVSSGSIGNYDLYLDRIVFHFGKDHLNGSEHKINGKRYGMEVQLYFTGDFGTYWESISKYRFLKPQDDLMGNNIHILSVMVEVPRPGALEPDDAKAKFSSRFEIISSAAMMFWKSKNPGMYRAVQLNKKLISLEDFLGVPADGSYYTYEGSLSHPPCLRHAKWTIFETPIWITYEQWLRFAVISSEYSDENFLAGNNRPLEDIMIKADVATYIEMRKIEGLPPLSQKELDGEIKMKKNSSTTESGSSTSAPASNTNGSAIEELYIIRPYTDFQKYFAKRVTKRIRVSGEQRDKSDEDYYDMIEDKLTDKSGSTSFHYAQLIQYINLIQILTFQLIFRNRFWIFLTQ